MKPILLFLLTCAMWGQGKSQKFYITGLAHSPTANDCTIPPIVAYGKDRVDALLHCCEGGGLTVWSEVEYQKMRQDIGRVFDESCKAAPKPAVSSDKHDVQCGKPNSPIECLNGLTSDGRNPGMAQEIPYSDWKTDPQRVFNSPPAPKPSFTVEKAVSESLNAPYPRVRLTCKSHPGYRSFLLPDESTGEKVCLNVLKEKP